ncbi:MAG: translation initiation factor IF-2 associated domain-containing protein [Alphaproteobacteria bacterium]
MTDNKDQTGKTLSAGNPPRAPLGVKRPVSETGTVKQSFSHGRTKAVVVEKKRTVVRPGTPAAPAHPAPAAPAPAPAAPPPVAAAPAAPARPQPAPKPLPPSAQRSGMVLRTLTEEEKAARSKAIGNARIAEAEARARAEADAKRRAEEEARLKREAEAAARRKAEDDARRAAEEEARRRTEPEPRRAASKPMRSPPRPPPPLRPRRRARPSTTRTSSAKPRP